LLLLPATATVRPASSEKPESHVRCAGRSQCARHCLDEACFAVVTRDGRDHNWRRSDEQVGDVRSPPCGPGITAVQAARPASSRVPMTQEANQVTQPAPTNPTPAVRSSRLITSFHALTLLAARRRRCDPAHQSQVPPAPTASPPRSPRYRPDRTPRPPPPASATHRAG